MVAGDQHARVGVRIDDRDGRRIFGREEQPLPGIALNANPQLGKGK